MMSNQIQKVDHREKCNSNYLFLEIQVIGFILAIVEFWCSNIHANNNLTEEARKIHQYCIMCFTTRESNEVMVIKNIQIDEVTNLSCISSFCNSSLQQFKTLFVFLSIKSQNYFIHIILSLTCGRWGEAKLLLIEDKQVKITKFN